MTVVESPKGRASHNLGNRGAIPPFPPPGYCYIFFQKTYSRKEPSSPPVPSRFRLILRLEKTCPAAQGRPSGTERRRATHARAVFCSYAGGCEVDGAKQDLLESLNHTLAIQGDRTRWGNERLRSQIFDGDLLRLRLRMAGVNDERHFVAIEHQRSQLVILRKKGEHPELDTIIEHVGGYLARHAPLHLDADHGMHAMKTVQRWHNYY